MANDRAPILNPAFRWISSASHDADSTKFRDRQLARIAAADEARKAAASNVAPIGKAKERKA
jgi:hypothetical protein